MPGSGDKIDLEAVKRQAARDDPDNVRHRERYKRRKAAGLCVQCGIAKADAGHVRCAKCHARQVALLKEHVEKRLAGRVCLQCGRKLMPTEKYQKCFSCRMKYHAYYMRRKCKDG